MEHWMEILNRHNMEKWKTLFRWETGLCGLYLSWCTHAGTCVYICLCAFLNVCLTESRQVSHHWPQSKIERCSVPKIVIFLSSEVVCKLSIFLPFSKHNAVSCWSWHDGEDKSLERVHFFFHKRLIVLRCFKFSPSCISWNISKQSL